MLNGIHILLINLDFKLCPTLRQSNNLINNKKFDLV